MAVPCPGCGRQYDITLFQYGRTIRCTCGRLVGQAHTLDLEAREGPLRFIADVMLGRLARWLRVIGCDTWWEREAEDADLVHRSVEEGRILLTRDRRIPQEWWVDNLMLVASEDPLEQLAEVVERFDLDWRSRLFSRCTVCNRLLEPMATGEEAGRVPEEVASRNDRFRRCPVCDRVYWAGGHTERMLERLERVLT